MTDMLNFDPAKRPTASECLQHKYFQVRVPIPMNAPDVVDIEASQLLEQLGLGDESMIQPDNTELIFDSADPFRQSKIRSIKQLEFNNN